VIPHKSAGIDIKICHGLLQRGIKVQPQDGGKTPWHKLDATTDANKSQETWAQSHLVAEE
jgi:hypothetical protein